MLESERAYTPELPVTIVHSGQESQNTMYCQPPKTGFDWTRQIGGMGVNMLFSLVPF
jgi:hypothetical protein